MGTRLFDRIGGRIYGAGWLLNPLCDGTGGTLVDPLIRNGGQMSLPEPVSRQSTKSYKCYVTKFALIALTFISNL